MTKIYIVTSGSYSDYHIESVFTDRGLAEHYVKLNPDSTIEEHTADDFSLESVRKEVLGYADVFVLKDSFRNACRGDHYLKLDGVVTSRDTIQGKHIALPKDNHITEESFETGVYAFRCSVTSFESPDHAKKLCVERLQRWRALSSGVA